MSQVRRTIDPGAQVGWHNSLHASRCSGTRPAPVARGPSPRPAPLSVAATASGRMGNARGDEALSETNADGQLRRRGGRDYHMPH